MFASRFAAAPRLALASITLVTLVMLGLTGCATASLSPEGARVAVTRNPPPPDCAAAGYLVGEGGGTFGGGMLTNEQLIDYAMNDLRNKAGKMGATYVQSDPPQLGQGKGTTTTATITGTAYRCKSAAL